MRLVKMTEALAQVAATDAGNRSMRLAGRTKWNRDDFIEAAAEFNRLWKSNEPMLPKPKAKEIES